MKKEITILDLADEEQCRFSAILKHYFPWLGTEDEDISGSDTITELDLLYRALSQGGEYEKGE